MSGILKRTAFMDNGRNATNGGSEPLYCQALDFALVETGLGTMVEPGPAFEYINLNAGQQPQNLTDMISMVNEIKFVPAALLPSILSNQLSPVLHGGQLTPTG